MVRLLTLDEAAATLGVHPRTLRRMMALPTGIAEPWARVGRVVRFHPDLIAPWASHHGLAVDMDRAPLPRTPRRRERSAPPNLPTMLVPIGEHLHPIDICKRRPPGVYFLVLGDEVVYVGQDRYGWTMA